MKTRSRELLFGGIILFISLYLTGCMTAGGRFYSGDLRSNQEVALLVIHQDLNLKQFSVGEKEAGDKHANLKMAELLPDSYNLCVSYSYHAAHSTVKSNGCISHTLNAQAGHIYYIYPFSDLVQGTEGTFRWGTRIADIASDADYGKLKEGEKIKNKVNDYLKGQRPEIKL